MDGMVLARPRVFLVAVENIMPLWPQLEPMIRASLRNRPTHTADDMLKMLVGQMAKLWAQMNGPTLDAFVVTQMTAFPQGIWLDCWLAGAHSNTFEFDQFYEVLTDYAQGCGLRGISGGGRLGWLKRYPQAQFEGVSARITFDA